MSIDEIIVLTSKEIITSIRSLTPDKDDGYILFPNEHYTPITDTLPDGTLVAYDAVSRLWSTQDMCIYRLEEDGSWTKKDISFWEKFVRKPNNHSDYPRLGGHNRLHAHGIVTRAWLGHVPEGWEIDHIDGDNMNFNITNLRLLPTWMNHRDGGFITKLRNQKIDPTMFSRPFLLRFFKRMAVFKSTNTYPDYCNLTRKDLLRLLVNPDYLVDEHPDTAAELTKYYDPFIERD